MPTYVPPGAVGVRDEEGDEGLDREGRDVALPGALLLGARLLELLSTATQPRATGGNRQVGLIVGA